MAVIGAATACWVAALAHGGRPAAARPFVMIWPLVLVQTVVGTCLAAPLAPVARDRWIVLVGAAATVGYAVAAAVLG